MTMSLTVSSIKWPEVTVDPDHLPWWNVITLLLQTFAYITWLRGSLPGATKHVFQSAVPRNCHKSAFATKKKAPGCCIVQSSVGHNSQLVRCTTDEIAFCKPIRSTWKGSWQNTLQSKYSQVYWIAPIFWIETAFHICNINLMTQHRRNGWFYFRSQSFRITT